MSRANAPLGLWAIFRWPLVIGVLGLIGLVGALLDDGPWDLIGAGLLAIALGVIVWGRLARKQ